MVLRVDALVFSCEVERPVSVEVTVRDEHAEGEDSFSSVQSPSGPAFFESVRDDVADRALDHSGRDRPALFEHGVITQVERPQAQDHLVAATAAAPSTVPARCSTGQ